MKNTTKLRKQRNEWLHWLFSGGDEVNGGIDTKFQGIISHALDEHSKETAELINKLVEKFEFSGNEYNFQDFKTDLFALLK